MHDRLTGLLFAASEAHPHRGLECVGGVRRSYPEILAAARRVAGAAVAAGVKPGDPVLLLLADGADFFPLFWGTLLAGATPAPVAPPRDASPDEVRRIERVVRMLAGHVVVDRGARYPGLDAHDAGEWAAGDPLEAPVHADAPALIQFSSGSTRDPRGVVLSHANLLHNVDQMARRLPLASDDVKLTWMPHFHDMGLIGCHLLPMALGMDQVRMDPRHALGDPIHWMHATQKYGATVLSTTNFALARLNARLRKGLPRGLDVSCVRQLYNGAEPISAEVCREFCRLTGLPEDVHFPIYGLAEATVGVCQPGSGGLRTLEQDGREVVSVGPPLPGLDLRVVDGDDTELIGEQVGHVQIRGPNVFEGYWRDAGATAVARCGEWVRTGDLGCVRDGELYVTGRHKDVICVNGRNLHAHDIEAVAEAVDGVRSGGAVAFADTRDGVEKLALGVVVDDACDAAPVLWETRRRVMGTSGVELPTLVPLPRLPRTTSGKKRRALVRQRLEQGQLEGAQGNTHRAVRAIWEGVLGRALTDDQLHTSFGDLGGTSVMAQAVLIRLEERFGIVPDHRVLLAGETVMAMARWLEQHEPLEVPAAVDPVLGRRQDVAVVGIACRFPGAGTPEELLRVASAREVHIGPPPADRWAGRDLRDVGGFIDGVDRFDAKRFGISGPEAAAMDPQQRLVLTLAADALEEAGCGDARSVGVFVGAGQQAYFEAVRSHLDDGLHPGALAGNLLNMIAARVSHQLDLRGPALAVDTACSASLVAVHLACQSLQCGECEVALAGGVNLNLFPTAHRLFANAGALSPSGRCRPFEPDADGMVPGEGAAVLVLKPLSRARADGDAVLGVVKGVAVNNDGSSLGVMAPNPAGQDEVIRRALAAARVDPADVCFIEAHGTGTPIGDAVEGSVLRRRYPHEPRRGAIKGQIGHLLAAAGVAGLIRALGELEPGEVGAVSSFGFGGTNAHALVEGGALRGRVAGGARTEPRDEGSAQRYWVGDLDAEGWVHRVRGDPAGGLQWMPCPRGEPVLRRGGGYLITGGAGAIGSTVARYLATTYGARLVLIGRSEEGDEHRILVGDLARLGGDARYIPADLADEASAADARDATLAHLGQVDGIFHCAGTLDADALRAKRDTLLQMEALGAGFYLLFSSISAVVPGLDHGIEAYAEANAWLDGRARERRSEGLAYTSVAWPPWEGGGMAAGNADAYRSRGIEPIEPRRAMAALEWALSSGEPHVVVLRRASLGAGAAAPPEDLREQLRALLADAAQVGPEQVGDHQRLAELGIDSLDAMELVRTLEQLLGRGLPTTLLFEYDTLDKVVRALEQGIVRDEETAEEPAGGSELLPSQQTFLVQREYFPDIPGNVFLACSLARPEGAVGSVSRERPLFRRHLARALQLLVQRHWALGTVVAQRDGRWVQEPGGGPPAVEWVGAVDEAAVANQPFDLHRGPLLRVVTDGSRLVLNAHHLAVDAWSLKIVLEELLAAHEQLLAGQDVQLPALPSSWPEAARQLAAAEGGSARWWRERFAHGVPPLPLPWDGAVDEPAHGPCGAPHEVLERDTTALLERRARGMGVSLPALVLASYVRFLFLLGGQHDVVVRVAHARREVRVADARNLVGSFADSLPVRILDGVDVPLQELARRTQAELAQAQAHAAASSVALASLAPRVASGPVGLTPAGFSFPHLPADSRVGGLEIERVRGASASGFTRVGLIAWVFDGRLHCSWNHTHSHLRPETAADWAAEHRALLETIARGGEDAPSSADSIHRRVLDRCAAQPDRPAIEGLTYRDIDRRSAALARRLSPPRVAVLAPPGPDAVVALLAVLRCGAAYVPLDPEWPDRRVRQILEAGRPTSLVTVASLEPRARDLAGDLPVDVVGDEEAKDGPAADGPLAYVMFTSGSTGRPKGVMVSHRAALAFLDWVSRVFGVTGEDRFLQTSSLGFGGSIRQIWSPLLAGATIHPVSRDTARDPDALAAFIRDRAITIYNSVPAMAMHLLAAADRTGHEDPWPALRWVLLGGEVVPAAHARRWRARFGDRHRLANLYGSTETIVNATWHEVTAAPGHDEALTPIGWARAGCEVHLLDPNEDGVGEIAVGGHIAEGYLGEPEQTAEVFVERAGLGRIYLTGDLARRRPDGALVYLGRRDSQVQIRGNRVELAEIEAALCGHPSVSDAVVLESDGRLHATVQVNDSASIHDLRVHLGDRLPAWMVPHHFDRVDQLPRTAAGKADRLALRQRPVTSAPTPPPEAGGVAPLLARVWQEVLELDALPGADDEFFALGGDSLLALVVLEKLRPHLATVPRPMALYRHRRLGDLARALEEASPEPPAACAPAAASPDRGDLPLTAVQRGFWLAHKLRPEHAPTWCASVPVRGDLDEGALRRALDWVIQRHPLLRTTFHESFAGPVQRALAAAPPLPLQFDDLSALPRQAQGTALQARWEEEGAARYDMERWPLIRVRLCKLGEVDHQLVLGAHHIVADAWSAWLLAGEVLAAHDAFARGGAPALPPPAGSIADDLAPAPPDDGWWGRTLAGLDQESAPPRERTVERDLTLEPATWEQLQQQARHRGVSPFLMVYGACFQTLQQVLGVDDLVVATALSGRDGREEMRGVVGPLAQGLPVRVRGPASVDAVARAFGEACAHADASPATLAAAAGPGGVRQIGRFFLSWLDPAAVPGPDTGTSIDWAAGRYRFATLATDTEVMVGALASEGLHLNLHGSELVDRVAPVLRQRLEDLARVDAVLVVYAPDGVELPVTDPVVVERVDSALGSSELVLLPLRASELASTPDLDDQVRRALGHTRARVTALAGMLPALTGLGARDLGGEVLTTGHAATAVAMVRSLQRALERTGVAWGDLTVGVLGYGSIGRAVMALAEHVLGPPARVLIRDPGHPESVEDLREAQWIVGATSGGRALDVAALAPGTVVVDDSFPRAFDDGDAVARMRSRRDVLLVGGGMLDAGPLRRSSPFPQAEALRARYGAEWLPGCHAEALLVAREPELGPTIGPVDLPRALRVWEAALRAGLRAAPLHLGAWEIPDEVIEGVQSASGARAP